MAPRVAPNHRKNRKHENGGHDLSSSKHQYEWFWLCCMCGDGLNTFSGIQTCTNFSCQHIRCAHCSTDYNNITESSQEYRNETSTQKGKKSTWKIFGHTDDDRLKKTLNEHSVLENDAELDPLSVRILAETKQRTQDTNKNELSKASQKKKWIPVPYFPTVTFGNLMPQQRKAPQKNKSASDLPISHREEDYFPPLPVKIHQNSSDQPGANSNADRSLDLMTKEEKSLSPRNLTYSAVVRLMGPITPETSNSSGFCQNSVGSVPLDVEKPEILMEEHKKRNAYEPEKLEVVSAYVLSICAECRRRKQKCDSKQPCNNCSRRYPAPQCIYTAVRNIPNARMAQATLPRNNHYQPSFDTKFQRFDEPMYDLPQEKSDTVWRKELEAYEIRKHSSQTSIELNTGLEALPIEEHLPEDVRLLISAETQADRTIRSMTEKEIRTNDKTYFSQPGSNSWEVKDSCFTTPKSEGSVSKPALYTTTKVSISRSSSLASITDSLFSDIACSSISSLAGPEGASERLATLLLGNQTIKEICFFALNCLERNIFEDRLRNLIKQFTLNLRKEADTKAKRSAAKFLRFHARNSAHIICDTITREIRAEQKKVLSCSNTTGFDIGSDSEESESDHTDDELDDMRQYEISIKDSQAMKFFVDHLRTFVKTQVSPPDFTVDNDTAFPPSTENEDFEGDNGEEFMIRNSADKTQDPNYLTICEERVSSQFSYLWQFCSRVNGWTSKLGQLIHTPVPDGKTRIEWKCKCGYKVWDDFQELHPGALDAYKKALQDNQLREMEPACAKPQTNITPEESIEWREEMKSARHYNEEEAEILYSILRKGFDITCRVLILVLLNYMSMGKEWEWNFPSVTVTVITMLDHGLAPFLEVILKWTFREGAFRDVKMMTTTIEKEPREGFEKLEYKINDHKLNRAMLWKYGVIVLIPFLAILRVTNLLLRFIHFMEGKWEWKALTADNFFVAIFDLLLPFADWIYVINTADEKLRIGAIFEYENRTRTLVAKQDPKLSDRKLDKKQGQDITEAENSSLPNPPTIEKLGRIISSGVGSLRSAASFSSSQSTLTDLPLHERQASGPRTHSPPQAQAPTTPTPEPLFLLLCYPSGRYSTSLLQLDLISLNAMSDRTLFHLLRSNYHSMRGRWLSFFSLRTLAWIKFVAFEMHPGELIDVRKVNDIPPPEHKDYKYDPAPPDVIPPVGENHLMHLFHNPACATDNPLCLSRFPKKLKQKLLCNGGINPGWGLQFVESWDAKKIWLLAFVFFGLGSLLFGILWAVFEHSIQDAFSIAGYMVAFATISVGSLQALLVM